MRGRQKRSLEIFESRSSSKTQELFSEETCRRERSLRLNDHPNKHRDDVLTKYKFKYLDTRIDAINTGVNTPILVDALIR